MKMSIRQVSVVYPFDYKFNKNAEYTHNKQKQQSISLHITNNNNYDKK